MTKRLIIEEDEPDVTFGVSASQIPGGMTNARHWMAARIDEVRQRLDLSERSKLRANLTIHYGLEIVLVRIYEDGSRLGRTRSARTYEV